MECSFDLTALSGILVNATTKFGGLLNIRYKGLSDNETKISYVIESLKSFLSTRGYIDDLPKPECMKELTEVSLFLAVNCEFSQTFKLEEYTHLTYNVPKISKYLLARIIVTLNLTEAFCSAVLKLPLVYSSELFGEFLHCIDKLTIRRLLQDTYTILQAIAVIKINNKDLKFSDNMDTLDQCIPEFFFKFCRVSVDQLPKLKKDTVFELAGYALNKLLSLLLFCQDKNLLEGIFIDRLIEATLNIVRGVSIDMYIYWAEIDLESGFTLQNEISERAYNVIEKYHGFKPASELIQSLRAFAIKPKDIREQISTADIDRIILMVNKCNEHQKKWFQALIFSSFTSNDEAIDCISKWSNLCDADDVSRLLNLTKNTKNEKVKELALKCLSSLSLDKLIVIMMRHFQKNGFIILQNDIHSELVLLFNSFENAQSISEKENFELLILLLKNIEFSVNYIYTECLKSTFYATILKDSLVLLKNILGIHNIGLNCLQKVIKTVPPSTENIGNYEEFFKLLLSNSLISNDLLITRIINSSIDDFMENNKIEELKHLLKVLNVLDIYILMEESMKPFVQNLLKIIAMRTKFVNHNSLVQATIRETVILITRKFRRNEEGAQSMTISIEDDDKFVSYYQKYIGESERDLDLLEYLFENFPVENNVKAACLLMEILPSCVTEEWLSICQYFTQKSTSTQLITTIKIMMIFLCQFTSNQENAENYPILLQALKYCTQQVGIVMQNCVQYTSDELNEISVTEAIVALLTHLPPNIKETEGLNLINIMSKRSLKKLGEDKKFVEKICQIKNTKVCQVIAQKILD